MGRAWWAAVHGIAKVGHDLVTNHHHPPPKMKRIEILIYVNVLKSNKMVHKGLSLLPRKCFNYLSPQICPCCSVSQSHLTPCDTVDCKQARPPCPSPSPEVCSHSCPLHQRCHPAISFSDALFSFCPPSLPASGTFPMSRLSASGGQNPGASVSISVLPTSTQD